MQHFVFIHEIDLQKGHFNQYPSYQKLIKGRVENFSLQLKNSMHLWLVPLLLFFVVYLFLEWNYSWFPNGYSLLVLNLMM